ncbi:response regulator transcription factor [Bifidobacterium sp. ESL0682]|uniref:response regulator transcription factor n=1 Tax=Bifidobacterium sp. ESL0682 TaxID=2983212 RepID=UPI0023F7823E|nr:response regulator transcription factor [Bifidobacterium sp. ESL0682]WEV41702.1 response regulator transcription factor [Bifidobacterium sp. ESL0682]
MEERRPSSWDELHIVVIDDDPCALHYEKTMLSHLQNRNGCHVRIWGTTKLEDGVQKCLYDFHPVDIVIIDMTLKERKDCDIFHELAKARSDIIVIGMTSHIGKYRHRTKQTSQMRCIVDKAQLNHELPRIIDAIYRERTPRHRSPEEQAIADRSPFIHCKPEACQPQLCLVPQTYCPCSPNRHHAATSERKPPAIATHISKPASQWQSQPSSSSQKNMSQQNKAVSLRNNRRKQVHDLAASAPTSHNLAAQHQNMQSEHQDRLISVPLTPTELQIVKFSILGLKPQQIAKRLGISASTVYSHRSHIKSKCHAKTWMDTLLICQQKNGTG